MTGSRASADIVIVGAGFSGLGMAIALSQAGRDDFLVLEKAGEVGGTWRENTYPGCACDIRSLLYSYSFAPNHAWTRLFPPQPEILDYLRRCADRYRVREHVAFGTEAAAMAYDDAAGRWRVRTAAGEVIDCRVLIAAIGPLHHPRIPDIPGAQTFTGPRFHSARWDHGAVLDGKRVAVIGTGASAVQFVPLIAERALALTIFQRSAPWVVPKPDRELGARAHRLFRAVPGLQRACRYLIYWQQEAMIVGLRHPRLIGAAQAVARRHLHRQVADPELRRKLTPGYRMGCKRILVSSDYYPALGLPHVRLETSPVDRVTPDGVLTADGVHHPADVLIYATDFHVTDALGRAGAGPTAPGSAGSGPASTRPAGTGPAAPAGTGPAATGPEITGAGGLRLADAWRDGAQAYLGMAVAGFPNMFLLLGPNSGLGHNSMVFMIEAQTRYLMGALGLADAGGAVAVRREVQRRFNQRLQRRLRGSVWTAGGCLSWYLDDAGVNRALWPGSAVRYWWRTRRLAARDYQVIAGQRAAEATGTRS